MAEWGPFMSYWGTYCKDVFQNALLGSDTRIIFSEGLLHALYYETDVGCIPRGIKLGSRGIAPKFVDANNWNKQIQGCYWCQDDNNTFQGVCCERDCFYLLHEWCIERAVHFTRDRFCRLPGCNKVTYNNTIYCNEVHRAKFDSTFPKWSNSKSPGLKSAVRAGPTWYHQNQDSSKNKTSSESSTHPQSKHPYDLRSKSASNSTQLKSIKVQFSCSLPMEFRNILIHQTDIGVIPRTCPSQEDLASKYSQCPNWSAVIKGCYYCGRPETKDSMNDHFCQLRCYLLFYEWCRTKVESMVKMSFCQYPECPRKAAEGFHCCTRDHTVKIPDLYKDNRINNIEQTISVAPKWYVKANTPHELVSHLQQMTHSNNDNDNVSQQPPIHYNPMINCLLCQEMTLFLYLNTDIGPIPRKIQMYLPTVQGPSPNWCAQITACYWCCSGLPTFHFIACSYKCLFLFIEWLHMKSDAISNKRFCKSIGCANPRSFGYQCCNRDHSILYESTFKEHFPMLKHTEFALGPMWYNDYTQKQIMFYNREDPFYEFTNFFPCDNLFVNNVQWKTSEHYFQAMKFYGTPYFHYVSTLPSPRDAFSFSRKPHVMKWIHPRWHSVKLIVMLNVLRAKFCNNYFARILLRTGDAFLIEHTKIDKFWGDGGDGSGENKLGILLMQVRSELRFANINQINQQIPIQPSANSMQQCKINAATHQEVNKQIQTTTSNRRNNNGNVNKETKSTSVRPDQPQKSIHKTDSNTAKQSENVQPPGFIANLVTNVTPKPNNISETSDTFGSNYNPFHPAYIEIKHGEARLDLPADYKCPFGRDSIDLEPGDEHPRSPTHSNKLARIQSENDKTKQIEVSNSDPFQEMDTSGDSDDLMHFPDDEQGKPSTLMDSSNESPLSKQNNKQDISIGEHNPLKKDFEDKSPKSADNSSLVPGCFEQSPSLPQSPKPNVQSVTSPTTKSNPFEREKNTDNKSQNYNELSSVHPTLTSETVNSGIEMEELLNTNSSNESGIESVLSGPSTTNLPITTDCNPFRREQKKDPFSDVNSGAVVGEDESMEISQPNDQIEANPGSADQVQASFSKPLVSKVPSESS